MDLEYLNGVPDTSNKSGDAQDFMGLMGEQEALSELGKLFKRKAASGGGGGAPKKKIGLFKRNTGGEAGGKKKAGAKVKNFLKKGLHITNRLNPAAATLRAGILAAMKLNFMKIGGQIRYAYLTEEQAQQKGLVMDRYRKMKTIREKLEKIFYGAGGKPENLKKAILTGRGNKNKEVPMNGLGFLGNVDGLNDDMPLSQLLGREMYLSESMDGLEGLGSLGEPATAATIAAATTVLTTIAALIKSVGSLVPKKKAAGGEGGGGDSGGGDSGGDSGGGDSGGDGGGDSGSGSSDSSSGENSSSDSGSSESGSDDSSGGGSDEGTNGSASKPAAKNSGSGGGGSSNDSGGDDGDDSDSGGTSNANKGAAKSSGSSTKSKPSFWENNKKWIKPVGIGVGSLGLIALFWHLFKPKPQPQTKAAMNGLPAKKSKPKKKNILSGIKTKKGGNHPRKKKTKKKVVTLL